MANDLRVEIIGNADDLYRALAGAAAALKTFNASAKKSNNEFAQDTEKTGKRIKSAWFDAERGLFDFRKSTQLMADAIATKRGGPINSITRGIANVIEGTGLMADKMQRAISSMLPVVQNGEKIGGFFENLGLSMANVVPIIGVLLGAFSTLSLTLLALPATVGAVVFAFTALLEVATILGAGLLALSAPVVVVTGLLGLLGGAFAYVTAMSLKNKGSQQQVHDSLLKLHVAQQTYNQDLAKYGKGATQTENALLALHKAQDVYQASQQGLSLNTDVLKNKFEKIVQTLSTRFRPAIVSLVGAASHALDFLGKIAKLPLAQAFHDLSTTGVRGVTHAIQQIGFALAKPFKLAIKFGFGEGQQTLGNQVKGLYAELTNFLTGSGGALNPVVHWFDQQDFTETGIRWAHELIGGLVGLWNRDRAFHDSVMTVLTDSAHIAGQAFVKVLKWEISQLWSWIKSSGVGAFAVVAAGIVVALGPVISIVRVLVSNFKLLVDVVGRVVTMLTSAALAQDELAVSATGAAAAENAAAASTIRAGEAAVVAAETEQELAAAFGEVAVASEGAAGGIAGAGAAATDAGGAAAAAGGAEGFSILGASLADIIGAGIPFVGAIAATIYIMRQGSKNALAFSDALDHARTASDRLANAQKALPGAKLNLKQDQLQLQQDRNNVKQALATLSDLQKKGASRVDIRSAQLAVRQARLQVQSDKQIVIPLDKEALKKQQDAILAQTGHFVQAYRDDFQKILSSPDALRTANGKVAKSIDEISKAATRQHGLDILHGDIIKSAKGMEIFANKVRASHPALAKSKDDTAALALATDELTQKIGKVPSTKAIKAYYTTNIQRLIQEAHALASEIEGIPSSKTINVQYFEYHTRKALNSSKEAGGSVRPDTAYNVGERGAEIYVPGGSGVMAQILGADGPETFTPNGYGTILPAAETAKIAKAHAKTGKKDIKTIREVMNKMWRYIGHMVWPGYNQPPVAFKQNIHDPNMGLLAGEGWPGSHRHIVLDPTQLWGLYAPDPKNRYGLMRTGAMHLILHEWAHAFQDKAAFKNRKRGFAPEAEGGAEWFAFDTVGQVMRALGIHGKPEKLKYSGYYQYLRQVMQEHHNNEMWALHGQFVHKGVHTLATRKRQAHEFDGVKRHGYGGNAWPGEVSLVGEHGPELRYEHAPARYLPAGATQRMMQGAECHYHFHFPNAAIVDKKTVEQAARLVKPVLDRMSGRS